MTIIANELTKRFNRNVIFKNFTYTFSKGEVTAVLGPNGSGKSTLLRVLSGQLEPDEGSLSYFNGESTSDNIFQSLGFVAPYIDVPEEFTFKELLAFQRKFKHSELSNEEIIDNCHLRKFQDTSIKEFSSGMKQRVKLSLNLFFEHKVFIFDEPCSHLDKEGFDWFNAYLAKIAKKGIVIVGSNNPNEYLCAKQFVDIQDFK